MKKSICNRAKVDVHFSKKQNQTKGNKMAKKFFMAAMAAVLAVTFTACSSISTGTTVHGMKLSDSDVTTVPVHVNGEIWGVYLFGILPLMTGSSAAPGSMTLFKDTVRVDNAVSMLTKRAKDMEANRVNDVTSFKTSTWLLLFAVKEVQVSGKALK